MFFLQGPLLNSKSFWPFSRAVREHNMNTLRGTSSLCPS